MKKLVALTVLILALSASTAMAFNTSVINGFDVDLSTPGTASSALYEYIDTGFVTYWDVYYDGSSNVTANLATATLTGNFADKVWSYEYEDWTAPGTWLSIDSLVSSSTSSVLVMPVTVQSGTLWGTATIQAQKFRVGYDVTLSSTAAGVAIDVAKARGLANMRVTQAVPEASTLVGFGSALAMAGPGLIGWLRRRRS